MKMTPAELLQFADKRFERQKMLLPMWQSIADNFYPERADFTHVRNVGTELADSLLSSYPLLVRRDLGNAIGSMLRDGDWFRMTVAGAEDGEVDHEGRQWLQQKSRELKRIMYDRQSNFVRATKEGDHDYVTFGQPVISLERRRDYDGLLFRTWHIRDCAWWENENGQVCGMIRKWNPELRELRRMFGPDKLAHQCEDKWPKEAMKEINCYHIWMPVEEYGEDSPARYVSIYIDIKHQHIIEEVFLDDLMYIVPRFQTIAGSPYAFSPAVVVGLPDSRMLQAMTHTLMEAGERYVRPPLAATSQVVQSAVDLSPNGITWLDKEYDERNGQALRPLYQDRGGFPIGLELREDIKETLKSAFYINKFTLPEVNRDMTAYEVAERMKQFRRENLPLVAPIEAEYNGMLCESAFTLALRMGLLGSERDIPRSIRGRDVEFKFESPLSEADEEKKATRFSQVAQLLSEASQFDQGAPINVDFDTALRDAIQGLGAPERWLNPMDEVDATRDQVAQEQAAAAMAMAEQEQEMVSGAA